MAKAQTPLTLGPCARSCALNTTLISFPFSCLLIFIHSVLVLIAPLDV